jgi:Phosphodiester glycosidase
MMINKRTLVIAGSGLLLLATSAVVTYSMTIAKTKPIKAQIADLPTGYQRILSTSGVKVFKNSTKSSYITVIDLNQAEAIDLTGKYTDEPNGKVAPRSMSQFWQDSISQNTPKRQAQVVINGAFFAKYNQPTEIAFGLKSAGIVISYGYGLKEFPGLNKTIAWNNTTKQATITDYDRATFDRPQFPEVVGALAETAGKRANRDLARTFIGVKDPDGDGENETIMIFSSKAAKQIDAVKALRSFGAKQVAMLDGGGSTGLVVGVDGTP